MERDHQLTTKVVFAVILENGKTAQLVKRDAARRSPPGASCPDRLKRGQEAE